MASSEQTVVYLIIAAFAYYAGRRSHYSMARKAYEKGWAYGLARGSATGAAITDAEKAREYRRGWQDREDTARAFRN